MRLSEEKHADGERRERKNREPENGRGRSLRAANLTEQDADSSHGNGSGDGHRHRSEEHTSELQSLMRSSYAVFCLKKKTKQQQQIIRIATSLHVHGCCAPASIIS